VIPYHVIRRKRDGIELSVEELKGFFTAFAEGRLPEYQMAAFLMATCFRGLTPVELRTLVDLIINSGVRLDFSEIEGPKIDKHSTGGVGDKVSLVLAPLVASLGVTVPMMSGRGLGHSGGTVDKLESIPGFNVQPGLDAFRQQLERIGCALITQTDQITPLDKKLYALRDVSGTVESIPLIASSIMSKKIAEGIDGLVLDVKRGNGAFLPELDQSLTLAQTMISIGEMYGKQTVALLTAMDRPLGHAVGNAIEVEESIHVLRGEGPSDLKEVTVALAVEMLLLAGWADARQARADLEGALADGRAATKFQQIIEAQGGNPAVVDDPALLPQAQVRHVLEAKADGWIEAMDVRAIGDAAVQLGAGRATLDAVIDHSVGFLITAKTGDRIVRGQPIASVFATDESSAALAIEALHAAITVSDETPAPPLPLVSHRVTAEGIEELA